MEAEGRHQALDQSSQARVDPEASLSHNTTGTPACVMLEPEQRTLLLTGRNYTPWAFWMRGRLLRKGLGVVCSEDEKDSGLTPEKEAEAFDLLLSSMSESTLSRVLSATSARDVWVILRKLYAGSTALAYENEIHQRRYKDGTSIEEHFHSFRLLVAQYRAVGGTMSDVSVALAMLRTFSDSATYKGIITAIRERTWLEELSIDDIESEMLVEARDIDLSNLESGFGASGHPLCPHCGGPIIHQKGAGSSITTKDPKKKTAKFLRLEMSSA